MSRKDPVHNAAAGQRGRAPTAPAPTSGTEGGTTTGREWLRLFQSIVHASSEAIAISDPQGRLVYVNPAHERLFGRPLKAAQELNYRAFYPPKSIAVLERDVVPALERGESWEGVLEAFNAQGERFMLWERADALRDDRGRLLYAFGVMHDVSHNVRAHEELYRSEERLRKQYNGVPVPTYTWKRQGDTFVLIDYNAAAAVQSRGRAGELVGQTLEQVHAEEPDIQQDIRRCHAEGRTLRRDLSRNLRSTGETRDLAVTYVPIPPDLVMIHTEDQTERRRAEARYKGLVEDSLQGMALIQDGRFTLVNEAAARIADRPVSDLLGTPANLYVHPEDQSRLTRHLLERLLNDGPRGRAEFRVRRPSGEVRWIDLSTTVSEHEGRPALQEVIIDITERKRAEQSLQIERDLAVALSEAVELEPALARVLEAACQIEEIDSGGVYLRNERGDLRLVCTRGVSEPFVSAVSELPADTPQAALISTGVPHYLRPPHPALGLDALHAAEGVLCVAAIPVRSEGVIAAALTLGSRACAELPHSARDALEAIASLVGGGLARIRASTALRESRRLAQRISDTTPALLYVFDLERRCVVHGNRRLVEWSGVEPERVDEALILDRMHPDDRSTQPAHYERLAQLADNEPLERRFRARDHRGRWRWLQSWEAVLARHPDGRPSMILGTAIDVTERHEMEQALRRSEQRFREALENSRHCLYRYNGRTDCYDYISPSVMEIAGYTPEEFRRKGLTDAARDIHPEDWPRVEAAVDAAGRQQHNGRASIACEYRRRTKDGRYVWLEDRATLIFDANGQLEACVGSAYDISERKQAAEERRRLEAQLQHAQKLEAVGQLAGGIAHDFNNLLSAIFGYTNLARDTLEEDHPAATSLEQVVAAAEQAAGVVRSLLTFSRKAPARKEVLDLYGVIQKAARLLQRVLPSTIELRLTPRSESPLLVEADGTMLQQVIMNLAINARDAMPAGGLLQIGAMRQPPDAGGRVQLVVRDNGTGIPSAIRGHIFEPFFTTKPAGHGTGLGLAVIHGIVEHHDGSIDVDSEPGRGTTFTVTLAAASPQVVAQASKRVTRTPRGAGELILVAEDDQHIRRIMVSALERMGYDVLPVDSGARLLQTYRKMRPRVRLLLADEQMPKGTGLACLRKIRAQGDDIPAILMTAGPESDLDSTLDAHTMLLQKPFQLGSLAELVSKLLDPAAARETPS